MTRHSHTWILTSGKITDIENELYRIYGSGPVDGVHSDMLLTRAELTGLTAISIVASLLLTKTSAKTKVKIICDNKGAIQASSKATSDNLRFYRRPNTDLILTQKSITKGIPIMNEWVKGHSDSAPWKNIQDLILQQLSRDEIFNVWCNRMAENEWMTGSAPCINQKTTLAEQWAVFSKILQEHQLMGIYQQTFHNH